MAAIPGQDQVFTPYSSIKPFLGSLPTWYPEDVRERVAAYEKYDEIYWNDDTQFVLRVLEGEEPVYIPNARTIVDTTSHYLLKGLQITVSDPEKFAPLKKALDDFLKREQFYSRFHIAKHAGVSRGDFALHLTADPLKAPGTRLALNSVHPGLVVPIFDDEDSDKLLRVHLVDQTVDPDDANKVLIHKLTYEYEWSNPELRTGTRKVIREEALYELEPKWYGPEPKLVKQIIPKGPLSDKITTIPLYWFKNISWGEEEFGSSELRGFIKLLQGVSQATTDQQTALGLEGLGVYATDSGRPVNDEGKEVDWEVAPGKVMEVATGGYFRRVEGVGSLKPSMDHINYLESKLREAGGLSDVALGRVDVQTAQSGIALAIKFIPTLAKIEERDTAGVERLQQLFHDWKIWMSVYENMTFGDEQDIVAAIGEKLPENRTEKINELNNMLDRSLISKRYYRAEMQKLGYTFPDDIETQIEEEKKKDAELAALAAPPGLQDNAQAAAAGEKPLPQSAGGAANEPKNKGPNRSNNKNKVNESKGTESGQSLARQAGGKPGK
jgi:hypothetical protein